MEHLNNNRTEIHRLNRAQIIDDAYHLMMLEELKYDDFLGLVENLWMERDYAPWHTVSNILHYMSPFFNFPEMNDFKVRSKIDTIEIHEYCDVVHNVTSMK